MKAARKVLAFGILSTFTGLIVEAQLPDGRWQRAPLTGMGLFAGAAVLAWAERELKGEAGD